jgi:uncharacterized protein YlaI
VGEVLRLGFCIMCEAAIAVTKPTINLVEIGNPSGRAYQVHLCKECRGRALRTATERLEVHHG